MNKRVVITYCVPCGYIKRAMLAADALKAQLGVDAKLIPGQGGIFKVEIDDNVVTQRTRLHFPDTEEIVRVVADFTHNTQV